MGTPVLTGRCQDWHGEASVALTCPGAGPGTTGSRLTWGCNGCCLAWLGDSSWRGPGVLEVLAACAVSSVPSANVPWSPAGCGEAWPGWGSSWQTNSVSWDSCALMAWFFCVMWVSLVWTSCHLAALGHLDLSHPELAAARTCTPWGCVFPEGDYSMAGGILYTLVPGPKCALFHQTG